MARHVVLLGPPGAGKGTHARLLSERFQLAHIATGDLLRFSIRDRTPVGKQAKSFIERGQLVPDPLILDLIRKRFQGPDVSRGGILDGFPRNVEQAKALDDMFATENKQVDLVLDFHVSEATVIERLSGRRTCSECGANYHLRNIPPKREGICDRCGKKLTERKDDRPATIRERLKVYHVETAPLIEFYRQRKILRSVDGNLAIEPLQKKLVEYIRSS